MRKALAGILVSVLCSLFNTIAFASVNDDQVTSQKIKEADGTSGQNTNSGSGVKTNHLQNGAVTSAKIANGAVTDAKITGPIAADKIAGGTFQTKVANVVTVAKSGGDFADPITAITSITNASATNPYLVKVMPGIYDLGTGSVQMKDYVDLEGSGQENTIIKSSNYDSADSCTVGTVRMANNSSIRHITVVNNPPNAGVFAAAAIAFDNVKAKAEGVSALAGSDTMQSVYYTTGICTNGQNAEAILNNVYVEARNNGTKSQAAITYCGKMTITNSRLVAFNTAAGQVSIFNDNSGCGVPASITVSNSTLEGTCPTIVRGFWAPLNNKVYVSNSSIRLNAGSGTASAIQSSADYTIINSQFASDGAVIQYNVFGDVKISNSLLPGDLSGLSNAKLVNNYDANFNPIPNQ